MAPSAIVGARERRHPVAVVPAVVGNLIPAAVGRRGTMPSLCALIGVFEISGRSLAGGGADAGWDVRAGDWRLGMIGVAAVRSASRPA